MFQFFWQNAKRGSLFFLQNAEMCFNVLDKLQKNHQNFLFFCKFFGVFSTCVQFRNAKISCILIFVVVHWFNLNFSSVFIIKEKFKILFNYKKRSKNQTIIYKNNQSKSCRECCRFSIERRAARGCSGCCGAGDVIVSEKPPSLSIMMEFSADPISSQGNRKSSTGWATYLEPGLLG